MVEMLDWNDLRLFLAVARAGGLAPAIGTSGLSAPTLGRRMLSLERALGVSLFERRRDGYDLTAAGAELVRRAEVLEEGALGIERWRGAIEPAPTVRIAAGAWTSAFLARHAGPLTAGKAAPTIEILTGAGLADLVRREAELGIRNRRPEQRGLAGRRLGSVAFAVYGAPSYLGDRPEARDGRRSAASTAATGSCWHRATPRCPRPPGWISVCAARRGCAAARPNRCSTQRPPGSAFASCRVLSGIPTRDWSAPRTRSRSSATSNGWSVTTTTATRRRSAARRTAWPSCSVTTRRCSPASARALTESPEAGMSGGS